MKELSLINCRLDRRYDVHEQLGRGSYAEIYLARDTLASSQSPHSTVVIKALNVFLQDDLDADLERTLVENFQNEAVALDRVRHPNIISRIGHGTARDLKGTIFHYLVLEHMSGGDLQTLVRKQKIPLNEALGYIEQICAGLGHAHEAGIIHRDIKPHNLLLNADRSTVKIADFGVARVNVSDAPITRVGTNIYAPPEHSPMFAGKNADTPFSQLTPAADIYSLAKSAYTLIAGEAPRAYANERITALPSAISNEDWSESLLEIFYKATADEPAERQQSVDEFWADLSTVRQMTGDLEYSTVLRADMETPQPHVSRGYSPIAPEKPDFEVIPTQNETRPTQQTVTPPVLRYPAMVEVDRTPKTQTSLPVISQTAEVPKVVAAVRPKKRKTLRRLVAFPVILVGFTGILYGTANYMRGLNILPEIRNPFKQQQVGTANTDIYLRPNPNTDNDPIGLVTKNSKVRIVNSRDNWYQVDVVEQGRPRPQAATATRGWLNGKYVDLSSN
jgi:serine/threonine protein kinase